MFTCNESDIYIPGWATFRARNDIQLPWFANNWIGKLFDVNCEHCKVR